MGKMRLLEKKDRMNVQFNNKDKEKEDCKLNDHSFSLVRHDFGKISFKNESCQSEKEEKFNILSLSFKAYFIAPQSQSGGPVTPSDLSYGTAEWVAKIIA